MKQKVNFPLVVILIILLGISLLFFVFKDDFSFSQKEEEQQEEKQEEVDTSDWELYTSDYGYSMQYPKDWILKRHEDGISIYKDNGENELNDIITVSIHEVTPNDPNSRYSGFFLGKSIEDMIEKDPTMTLLGEIILDGGKAYEIMWGGYSSSYTILVEKNGYLYSISVSDRQDKPELREAESRILSTFKFIDVEQGNKNILTEVEARNIIKDRALEAITVIKNKDQLKLSNLVHPIEGVRFSPHVYVGEKDVVFSADQLLNFFDNNNVYNWGSYDGSGFPINLSPPEYYDKFIYNADFFNAEQISYNRIINNHNTASNTIFEFYPNSIVAEYYFSGFDPKFEGMDWKSLRLIFEEEKDTWYLVGVVSDYWTI